MDRVAGADVVIVGGGSCGSVLAARLSEDPDRTVLLLEHGSARTGPGPAHILPIAPGSPRVRRYGERIVRGVGLGGSGAVNGAYFVRATPADLRGWPPSWSYERMLPYFRRCEADRDFPDSPVHGRDGPIPVRRPGRSARHPVTRGIADAARGAGFDEEPDKNAAGPPGIGPVPANVDASGMRADPASAYLTARARARPNLTVRTGAYVRTVRTRGGRAVGVEVGVGPGDGPVPDAGSRGGPVERFAAGAVVLAAGPIESPALLWRSGLADPRRPREFSDHPEITVPFRALRPSSSGPTRAPLLEATLNVDGDAAPHGGAGAGAIEIRPYTAEFAAVGVALMTPRGHGVLRAHPDDPHAEPVIDHRLMSDPGDRRDARVGVELARELIAASGIGEAGQPQPGISQHLCGTCPMGADPDASTVDEHCRVRGAEGLWIADTSVFPRVPSRGPHATAVMLAERAADIIGGCP